MRLSCLPAAMASPETSVDRTTRMPTPSRAPASVSRVSSGRETISMPRTLSSSSAPRSILSATSRRMRAATLPEKLRRAAPLRPARSAGAGALGSAGGCAGDHHVSPWGQRSGPPLEAFLRPADLDAELALVDAETTALGLTRTEEIRVELPPRGAGGAAVVRGYQGRDVAGRTVHAVRVGAPREVVLAVGPLAS